MPWTISPGGICYAMIEDTAASTFADAARACHAVRADVCSNSQMQVLRDDGLFSGPSWTRSGADNDSHSAGGLLATQPDNPDLTSVLAGYACCP